jgi:lysophospholipase L1-like esterase
VVSLHVSAAPSQAPVHATTTPSTYLAAGDATGNTDGSPFGPPVPADYILTGVDVASTSTTGGTIAVLGDQLTVAGATGGACGGGAAYACTWVDDLAATNGGQVPGSLVNVSRAGTQAQDEWRLNDGSGTTAADPIGGHPATVSGAVGWDSTGRSGATFNGTNASLATVGAVLDTTQSFTIAAWVKPQSLGSVNQTFVAQQATKSSGFALEYDGTSKDWAFSRAESDTTNPTVDRAESTSAATAGVWTYLVGTFDAGTGVITLHVNGAPVATTVDNVPFASTGPLVIGRGFVNGAASNYVNGEVSDVQVLQRTVNPLEEADLWDAPPPQQQAPGTSAPSDYSLGITDGVNGQTLPSSPATQVAQLLDGLPNLRSVIVSLGANDVLNDESPALIVQNLSTIIKPNRAQGLSRLQRSNGDQVLVVLTTIPPLGLGATDPREQVREQLNADIVANYGDYGADGYVDFDKAVSGPTAGQVASNLLTAGRPNAAYYTVLSNAVLAALKVPPAITL